MKKIYQRIDDPRHGDCYKCAIASILDLEYEDVPHFIEFGEDWLLEAQKFFKEHGYDYSGERNFITPVLRFLKTRHGMFGRMYGLSTSVRSMRLRPIWESTVCFLHRSIHQSTRIRTSIRLNTCIAFCVTLISI